MSTMMDEQVKNSFNGSQASDSPIFKSISWEIYKSAFSQGHLWVGTGKSLVDEDGEIAACLASILVVWEATLVINLTELNWTGSHLRPPSFPELRSFTIFSLSLCVCASQSPLTSLINNVVSLCYDITRLMRRKWNHVTLCEWSNNFSIVLSTLWIVASPPYRVPGSIFCLLSVQSFTYLSASQKHAVNGLLTLNCSYGRYVCVVPCDGMASH